MALVDFTTYDDIRAALGVSADEIEDTTLSLAVYEYNLKSELEDLDSSLTLTSDFATVSDLDPAARSFLQERFFRSVFLFSTYAVAKHLTSSLPLFSPKEITDGKASMSRYAQNPYEKTIATVGELYDKYRTRAIEAYAAFQSTTATPTTRRVFLVRAARGVDPVTGS